jgi:Bacteriophage translational regulator
MTDDVFNGIGVLIELKEAEDFLKIKETLTRIGVASKKDNTLYQSCHILHKRGQYTILHFKELFILDGKEKDTYLDDNDIARRNTIAQLLEDWNLLKIKKTFTENDPIASVSQIKVIPFKEKSEWNLVPKYTVGKTK